MSYKITITYTDTEGRDITVRESEELAEIVDRYAATVKHLAHAEAYRKSTEYSHISRGEAVEPFELPGIGAVASAWVSLDDENDVTVSAKSFKF